MIYKYTELVLFKDGRVSVKEKRVCVKPVAFGGRVVKIYWACRLDSWFYAPKWYLSSGSFEIDISKIQLHKNELIGHILDVDSAFAEMEVIK